MGSVLAYQGFYDDPVNKRVKLDVKAVSEDITAVAQIESAASGAKSVGVDNAPVATDEMKADYSEYYATFTDTNDAYAFKYDDDIQTKKDDFVYKLNVETGEETAEITVTTGYAGKSGLENMMVVVEEKKMTGLVAYGSDSDDE